ncbi:TetR/AcrR family transcriptional regulator [Tabrizicola fusiformis]|uniref:TetR/AcrR family transcriptional regulator n=1 Tax=Tabrizicola sp. SY72 TaxID=2741673 RepID=UPI001573B8A6|nr:TetR/AcrR family transcriptional regulator [Tabrizicola sp. SY72]NTT85744.1 TetR/AcrR family transcriptional regulator [Tabrizicola sp. SY72]
MRPDHRSAVANLKRERMRARLIEAALLVVAAKGLEATMIDDVAATAGASRGSFYNYFFTLQELLLAANRELADEMVGFVLAEVDHVTDPAEKVARGLTLFLHLSAAHPLLARFAAGMGLKGLTQGSVAEAVLTPLLARGMSEGRFARMPLPEARDLLAATLLASLARTARGEAVDVAAIVAALLRGLGLPPEAAARLADLPVTLPEIPPESLVARTEAARRAG